MSSVAERHLYNVNSFKFHIFLFKGPYIVNALKVLPCPTMQSTEGQKNMDSIGVCHVKLYQPGTSMQWCIACVSAARHKHVKGTCSQHTHTNNSYEMPFPSTVHYTDMQSSHVYIHTWTGHFLLNLSQRARLLTMSSSPLFNSFSLSLPFI
jgi:hypothetical protein